MNIRYLKLIVETNAIVKLYIYPKNKFNASFISVENHILYYYKLL